MPASFPVCKGKSCPRAHCHQADEDFFVLRQCRCATPEAPFLFLVRCSAPSSWVLIDSGDVAEPTELVSILDSVVGKSHLKVVHTHPHTDHIGGDAWFASRPNTTVVANVVAIADSILPIFVISLGSGHSDDDYAFVIPRLNLLLSGDVIYPGYLYVRHWNGFIIEVERIAAAVKKYNIEWLIGCHIERDIQGGYFECGEPNINPEVPLALPSNVVGPLLEALTPKAQVIDLECFKVQPHKSIQMKTEEIL